MCCVLQIVRMEQLILQALDYHTLAPSSLCFLEYYLTTACPGSEDTPVHLLAQVSRMLIYLHNNIHTFQPSTIIIIVSV